jgi:hypothetical protein
VPTGIAIWRVDDSPVRVHATQIKLEKKLEDIIESDPSLLGGALMILGRQVKTDSGKLIDLLGIDAEGNVHILELKRDRTPRDVVAQTLDYGAWVDQLGQEEIRDIYAQYKATPGNGSFDEAFEGKFGIAPPESLNDSHVLTIVATDMDAATERIVAYLANRQVPINVLFFSYYEDDGRSYIARTWMLDETQAKASRAGGDSKKKEPWNGLDWYVSFGEYEGGRQWADALKYGFVSAGGAPWYSRTIRQLAQGARVFVYIPKVGYVGVGITNTQPQRFREVDVMIDGAAMPLRNLSLQGTYVHPDEAKGEEYEEWVVPVTWIKAVEQVKAFRQLGLFANQNSACKLRSQFTIDSVSRHFEIIDVD